MITPLRHWKTRALFTSWMVYWLVLAAVKLWPAMVAVWRATHGGDPHSSISANFGNGVLSLVVTAAGRTAYTGSVHLLVLAAWIALPPLALWLVWAAQRVGVRSTAPEVGGGGIEAESRR